MESSCELDDEDEENYLDASAKKKIKVNPAASEEKVLLNL